MNKPFFGAFTIKDIMNIIFCRHILALSNSAVNISKNELYLFLDLSEPSRQNHGRYFDENLLFYTIMYFFGSQFVSV